MDEIPRTIGTPRVRCRSGERNHCGPIQGRRKPAREAGTLRPATLQEKHGQFRYRALDGQGYGGREGGYTSGLYIHKRRE
ncbi:hypothetical protein NDU88_001759 [Pleurodeles waltl]|uniref:Uncharacterized protein n=1 Tax=Pleurodeles waltl TaxID=8319 RepID=A0AAV7T144_PLEWA|nr:hypothetical protein NDU88_001759 [Pleurodeles waltl]